MNIDRQSLRRVPWRVILLLALGVAAVAGALLLAFPGETRLTLYWLYAIPSHLFISPFAHEPALLYAAKYYPAWTIMIAGTLGCAIAGFVDYWILGALINHRRVRPKLDGSKLFRRALGWFERAPFFVIMLGALLPLPFYPFKFLAFASHYPLWKYQLAMATGRAPRFFVLALLGSALQAPNWLLGLLIVLGLVLFLWPRGQSDDGAPARASEVELGVAPHATDGEPKPV